MKNLATNMDQEKWVIEAIVHVEQCPRVVNEIQSNKIWDKIATGFSDFVVIICNEV